MKKEKTLGIYGTSAEDTYLRFMDNYVRNLDPSSRAAYKHMFDSLQLKSEKVLEVGVGTGRNLHRYPRGIRFTGIDLTPEMLEQAQILASKLGMVDPEFRACDAAKLDYGDNSFDVTVSTYTLCVCEQPTKVMEEMVRVTKPGGKIAVYDCRGATASRSIMKDQEYLENTMQEGGLWFDNAPAVVYNIRSPLDKLIEATGLKVIEKRIMELGALECLGMFVLEK